MGLGIKKEDTILITAGKEKGKKGRVLAVMAAKNQVIVEKANIIKKHMKPSKKYQQGGIIEKEAPLHVSNVMLVCPKCGKASRASNTVLENGKKVRICRKCKEVIDK